MSVRVFQMTPTLFRAYWDGGLENFIEAYGDTEDAALTHLELRLVEALAQVREHVDYLARQQGPQTFAEYRAAVKP